MPAIYLVKKVPLSLSSLDPSVQGGLFFFSFNSCKISSRPYSPASEVPFHPAPL